LERWNEGLGLCLIAVDN